MDEVIKILKKDMILTLEEGINILGNDKAVYSLEEKGVIKKCHPKGLGLFTLPEVEEGTAHFAAIKKLYSQCVISGKTALSLYDLSLDYIDKIDVDIPNRTSLANELLEVHRVVDSKINNVIKRSFEEKGIPFEIKTA